ncbi:MAG: hypothetical protein ACXVDD_01040 [Polyangia bacterium]
MIALLLSSASGCRLDVRFKDSGGGGGGGGGGSDLATQAGGDDMAPIDTDLGPGLSNTFDVTALKSPVAEHEGFTLRLTARDGSGAVLTGYAGTVTLTTDWGDVQVPATPTFTDGVAELAVSLNRETNAGQLAHIRAADGAMVGVSSGITVTAVAWVLDSTTPTIEPLRSSTANWDFLLSNEAPGLVFNASGFFFYYTGVSSSVSSIGRATSPDFNGWSAYPSSVSDPNPRVTRGAGWESSNVGGPALAYDGATYYMIYRGSDGTTSNLGLATSTDAINWTKHAGNPVFSSADATCPNLSFHHLVVDSPGTLRLFGRTNVTASSTTALCTATSTDGGKTWANTTKLSGFATIGTINIPGAVVKEGSVYRTWIETLSPSAIQYATSSDAVNWVVSASAQTVIPSAAAWFPALDRYVGMVDCTTAQTNQSNAYCRAHRL